MATYKACCIIEHGVSPKFEIRTLPRPEPGPNELLIKLNLTSICGSDYGLATGHLGPTRDILGHEGVGRIAALGSNVPSLDPSVQLGQRVGVAWNRDACGACVYCRHADGEVRCQQLNHSGRKFDGTFAQYTLVPLRYLTRIPAVLDEVPDELVAPVLCGGVTAYKAIKECGITPGSWLGISGAAGGVGGLGVQFARAMGYRVLAVDVGEGNRGYCLESGAEAYVDVKETPDLKAEVERITEGRRCAGVVVAAGSAAAYQDAFAMLAPFGTYMCVGIPPPQQKVTFHPLMFLDNGAKVTGSAVGTRVDIVDALEFVKRGVVKPNVEWAKLEDMESLMKWVAEGKIKGKYIIKLDQD